MSTIVSNKALLAKIRLLSLAGQIPLSSYHILLSLAVILPFVFRSDLAHSRFLPQCNPPYFLSPSHSVSRMTYADNCLTLGAPFLTCPGFSWMDSSSPTLSRVHKGDNSISIHTGQPSTELEWCSAYRTVCMRWKILSGHPFQFMNLFGSLCSYSHMRPCQVYKYFLWMTINLVSPNLSLRR